MSSMTISECVAMTLTEMATDIINGEPKKLRLATMVGQLWTLTYLVDDNETLDKLYNAVQICFDKIALID